MVVSREKKKGMGKQKEKPENKRLQYSWEQLLVRYVCVYRKCTALRIRILIEVS